MCIEGIVTQAICNGTRARSYGWNQSKRRKSGDADDHQSEQDVDKANTAENSPALFEIDRNSGVGHDRRRGYFMIWENFAWGDDEWVTALYLKSGIGDLMPHLTADAPRLIHSLDLDN